MWRFLSYDLVSLLNLLQGLHDEEVPWQHALRISENIAHGNVRITLIKDGDHRLSREGDLGMLWEVVKAEIPSPPVATGCTYLF